MLNLSRVVNNPKFAQSFTITRSQGGAWNDDGVWIDATTEVDMYGIIQPATAKELNQVAEGDRVKEVKSFHSSQEMFITHTDGQNDSTTGISDIALHHNQQYRFVKLYPWNDFGYYKALGVRISGE